MLDNVRERERERESHLKNQTAVITWSSYQARSHSGIWPSSQEKKNNKTKQTKEIISIILFPYKDNDLSLSTLV